MLLIISPKDYFLPLLFWKKGTKRDSGTNLWFMAQSFFFTSRHNRSLCRLLCRGEALTTNEKVTVMGSSMCLITYFYIHGEETKMEGNSGRRSAE